MCPILPGDVKSAKFPSVAPYPEGRTDRSGRVIPHDFVLTGDLAARIHSVTDRLMEVWPLVPEKYARVWDRATAPIASA